MRDSAESILRTLFLIIALAIGVIIVTTAIYATTSGFMSELTALATVLGSFATVLFGSFQVYTHYFSETYQDYRNLEQKDIDIETAGVRPDSSYEGLDISKEDIKLSQFSPKDVARTILDSPNWQPAGDGGYHSRLRPYLKEFFVSDNLSLKTIEVGVLSLTVGSLVLLFFATASIMEMGDPHWIFATAASIYPDLSLTADIGAIFISTTALTIGASYFSFKNKSTCSVCGHPFSLKSHGRMFKPQHQDTEEVKEGDKVKTYRITHGVHIFSCEDCGSWTVRDKTWRKDLSQDSW